VKVSSFKEKNFQNAEIYPLEEVLVGKKMVLGRII
jgi:hypothetical protein